MKLSISFKIFVVLLLFVLTAIGLCNYKFKEKRFSSPTSNYAPYLINPLIITKVDHTTYQNAQPTMRIRADEIKINPRKFLIFNVRKVNELTITNANLEIYLKTDSTDKNPFQFVDHVIDPIAKNKNSSINLGLMTRGVIKNLDIKILNNQSPYLTIEASSAILNLKKKNIKLNNVRMAHLPSDKIISSPTVFWDGKKKNFIIPGEYSLKTSKGSVTQKNKQFDVNFEFAQ